MSNEHNGKMRVLDLNETNVKKVVDVVNYAVIPKHWYKPFERYEAKLNVPGDNKRHIAQLNDFRCVFSITQDRTGKLYRDLSISVPSDKYPHQLAAFTIAGMFGFTGWDGGLLPPEQWLIRVDEQEHCVRLCQEVSSVELEMMVASS